MIPYRSPVMTRITVKKMCWWVQEAPVRFFLQVVTLSVSSVRTGTGETVSALEYAAAEGLTVPLVYNCGGYESQTALRLLAGIVDIYMPDVKFTHQKTAQVLTGALDYPAAVKTSLQEMHRQVGDLQVNESGLAVRGLLIRHLVLPEGLAGTAELLRFLAVEISKDTYLNLMDQYHPAYKAHRHPPLDRPLHREEYAEAVRMARQAGLHRFA